MKTYSMEDLTREIRKNIKSAKLALTIARQHSYRNTDNTVMCLENAKMEIEIALGKLRNGT